jgi:hypothetical protein
MTIKLIGSDDYDTTFGQAVGYATFLFYAWGFVLAGWLVYLAHSNEKIVRMFGDTFQYILCGIGAIFLMIMDTQITIFNGSEWGFLMSWFGFAYLTIFLLFPFLKAYVPPTSRIVWIPTCFFLALYVAGGFSVILAHFLLSKYDQAFGAAVASLFFLSLLTIWISFLVGSLGCNRNPYIIACGIAIVGLTIYGAVYFIKGSWARLLELVGEFLVAFMLSMYSFTLKRQFEMVYPAVKDRLPLVHEHLAVVFLDDNEGPLYV